MQYQGRENDNGLSRLIFRAAILFIAAAVIFSLFWIRPYTTQIGELAVMVLWYLIVLSAVIAVLLLWRTPETSMQMQGRANMISAAAMIITVVGLIIAFLSGDKFDTVRAAVISVLLLLLNFPRRWYTGRMQY